MAAIGSHQSPRMKTDVWLTPPWILEALGPFDLDPCAPPARPWDTAAKHYTPFDDGLAQPWQGRVWLNPPYSREAVKWLARMADHGRGTALIFARTETAWFHDYVWASATAALFLRGRVHFHDHSGRRAPVNAGAPSVLVAYGRDDALALRRSGIDGQFIHWLPEAA